MFQYMPYKCPQCDEKSKNSGNSSSASFDSISELRRHIREIHLTKPATMTTYASSDAFTRSMLQGQCERTAQLCTGAGVGYPLGVDDGKSGGGSTSTTDVELATVIDHISNIQLSTEVTLNLYRQRLDALNKESVKKLTTAEKTIERLTGERDRLHARCDRLTQQYRQQRETMSSLQRQVGRE